MICAATTVCLAMPSFAYTLSLWDFGSDPLGEFDCTGHNDLVNASGVTIDDGAAVFDGTVRQFITGHSVDFRENQAYTIECWVLAETDCDGMIMELSPNISANGAGNAASYPGSFYLYAKEGAMVRGANGRYNGENFDSGNVCDGQWHHIAVIVDPTGATAADKVQLYLDGVRQTTHVQNNTDSCLRPYRLYIGSRGGSTLPFKGKIDDILITEGVLSTSQFMQSRSSDGVNVRAYWTFDNGNALADASGNGNTLQGSQGVTFANGCASFDGTASDVRTANTLDLSAYTDATIEFFIRKHTGADALSIVMELSQNATSYSGAFYFSLNEAASGAVNGLFRLADGYRYGSSPANNLNTGWHHVALVKDSSNAGNVYCISLYVDGVRMGDYTGNARNSGAALRNDYLYLGSRKNSQFFLDADIDDVRVTANALQPGQFLRSRTGSLDDTIAYWSFDKPAELLIDASGNGNALTGSGVTVDAGGSAVFDGYQSGFSTLAPLPLYPYESMTVEWFMKTGMSGLGIVLETSANALFNPGSFLACANESAGYQMTRTHSLVSNWSATDGRWHHYALVYDWSALTADIVRVYRDGVQVATRFSSNTSPARLRAGTLFIGTRNGSQYPFVGQLDDIRITGRALAPAEFMTERSRIPTAFILVVK
jgi:hypothetical protein